MKKNINVEVNSIRLEENTETPIMLLLDPNSQKVLPIWIGTIEAVIKSMSDRGVGFFETYFNNSDNDPEEIKIAIHKFSEIIGSYICLLYTSPSPRDLVISRMPSSA